MPGHTIKIGWYGQILTHLCKVGSAMRGMQTQLHYATACSTR